MKWIIGNLLAMLSSGMYLWLVHFGKLDYIDDLTVIGDVLFVLAISLFFGSIVVLSKDIVAPILRRR